MDNPLEAEARSPPPKLTDALRPLPSLPTEIMQRIIQLALPRLSFNTFRERYSLLLALSRVNKRWGALAQEELLRHVRLRTKHAAEVLLKTQSTRDAPPLPTKSLRLLVRSAGDKLERVEVSQVEALVAVSPKLEVLQVVAAAERLEDLALDYVTFTPALSNSPLVGIHLRSLTLSFKHSTEIASILISARLPQLEALHLLD
ncbi:hypothetical protein BCR35DRAFT_327587 [Leucosporidium creatinivorum]|uniref:F-box domain-containing protein n=1 Tax=Leucosporidium creatinivorum TaxID=106004 RepID=A0A1Y2G5W6_9BASI|nr:hypothetical protein BCR35DRAFT_327587 [Leucosporidium creatinivorum]